MTFQKNVHVPVCRLYNAYVRANDETIEGEALIAPPIGPYYTTSFVHQSPYIITTHSPSCRSGNALEATNL